MTWSQKLRASIGSITKTDVADIASSQPCATRAQARDDAVSGSWASGALGPAWSELHDHLGETPISRPESGAASFHDDTPFLFR